MVFLAFLLPLALYLLVLGRVNRQRRVVVVSGTWDLIGLLFASSGFLLLGGPAILTGLYERWRWYWLLREGQPLAGTSPGVWAVFASLSALYFAGVVGTVVYLFRRQRHRTCYYNAEPAVVQALLGEVFARLGLDPIRSGNLYVFGLPLAQAGAHRAGHPEGIQAPHLRPPHAGTSDAPGPAADEFLVHGGVLEVEAFAPLCHVTLRWDPATSPLREAVEAELARRLARVPPPEHETGAWLTLLGLFLLAFTFVGAVLLVLWSLVR